MFEEYETCVSLLFNDWDNGDFREIGDTIKYWLQYDLIELPFTARLISLGAKEHFVVLIWNLLAILYVVGVDDHCKIGRWFVNQRGDVLLQFEAYGIQDI